MLGIRCGILKGERKLPFLMKDACVSVFLPALHLSLLGFVVYLVFQPGMTGGFVFDDIPNLGRLAPIGDIRSFDQLLAFIFSSDSLHGRPLSMMTFAIDDQSWPMDAQTLKRTNILLHIVNVFLVFWCALLLIKRIDGDSIFASSYIYPLLIAMLWGVSPLQVSTVSYIIQRMTELSALFVLLGMVLYLKVRPKLSERFWFTIIVLSFFELTFLAFGIASKENALLLSLFCALIEYFFFSKPHFSLIYKEVIWRVWSYLFFFGPIICFLIYWAWHTSFFETGYERREFTLEERLLTQPRVIVSYIFSILIPKLSGTGLFFEGIEVSTGFFKPISTIASLILIGFLLTLSFLLRHRAPLVSFGIAFYFTGHLMESTFIPLEIYFEHRNYLPQFGIWLTLIGLVGLLVKFIRPKLFLTFIVFYICLFAFISFNSSTLWGSNIRLASSWYLGNMDSLRAAQFYASELYSMGSYDSAKSVLEASEKIHTDSLAIPISLAIINCGSSSYEFPEHKLVELAKVSKMETAAFEGIQIIERLLDKGLECPHLTYSSVEKIYEALLLNPYYASKGLVRSRIYQRLSEIEVKNRNLNLAVHYLDMACIENCTPSIRLKQAELLASAGLYEQAQGFIRQAEEMLGDKKLFSIKNPGLEDRISEIEGVLDRSSDD